jgi:hypothetical protein
VRFTDGADVGGGGGGTCPFTGNRKPGVQPVGSQSSG